MTAEFDVWDELLHQYVSDRVRVSYTVWKQNSTQTLNDWLAQLPVVALQASDKNHQL
ncbi:MAG: hypothetical protein IGS48_03650 [Oscillatoriales cyanobacterium C42_A2020_001]|nr:hypothetical protein [Leptolyngbyaceae cyanobacterium C42_A2020_001]